MSRTRPIYPSKRPIVRTKFPPAKRQMTIQTRARRMARDMANQRTGGFLGVELKFFDLARNSCQPSDQGNMTGGEIDNTTVKCLNAMITGNSQSTRIGRKITMKSLQIHGVCVWRPANTLNAPTFFAPVYIAVVLDTQTNSATTISTANVFINPGNSNVTNCNPMRNLEYTSRYKVLAWKRLVRQQTTLCVQEAPAPDVFSNAGVLVPFDMYINLKNIQVLYNAEAGTCTDITSNSLHLVAFSADGLQDIDWTSRLRYVG